VKHALLGPALLACVATTAAATNARADVPPVPPSSAASPAQGIGHNETSAPASEKPSVVVWPTLSPAGDGPSPTPPRRPTPAEKDLFERAQELDATLRDAVQDLGFTLFVADAGPTPGHTRDEDLLARAAQSARGDAAGGEQGTWVISPRVESAGGGQFVVRLVAVPPRGRELRVRVETVAGDAVGVRGLVMLRELLSQQTATRAAVEAEREEASRGTAQGILSPARSQGRAVLAVNMGAFGAFTAYSLEKASGSDDPRVLYPLLALGTGVGIGAALLVADEWDVTTGDAWYLSAGPIWGAASGFLIAAGQQVLPIEDRYSWGVGGGLIGLGLATFALTRSTMDDGDATLAHSGGALGLLVGGAIEYLYRGSTTAATPDTGLGFGSAIGAVAAGVLATQVTVSPQRVLLIDVGAGGGALLGAAAASPLIVLQNQTEANTRAWIAITLAGGALGGVGATWLTREMVAPSKGKSAGGPQPWRYGTPSVGVLGESLTRRGSTPVVGLAWSGYW
jgi:hypothetical protein